MKKLAIVFCASLMWAGSASAQLRSVAGVDLPPPWPAGDAVDTHWGTAVPDPYRALENTRDEAVQRWLRAQADTTQAVMARLPGRDVLLQRIRAIDDAAAGVTSTLVRSDDGRLFFLRREAGEQQFKLVLREPGASAGAAPRERVLIDPDALSKAAGRAVAIMDFSPSPDGRRLAYALQTGGGEIGELQVVEVDSGARLVGPIDRIRFSSVSWLPDGSGFFYSRLREGFDKLPATERFQDHPRHLRLLASGDDRIVFSPSRFPALGLPPIAGGYLVRLPGRPLVLGVVSLGVERNRVLIAASWDSVRSGQPQWRKLADVGEHIVGVTIGSDGALYLRSAKDAPRFQVLRWELPDDIDKADLAQARVVVPQGEGVISSLDAARDAIYLTRRSGVATRLWKLPMAGDQALQLQPVAIDDAGSVSIRHADISQDGVIVRNASWTRAGVDWQIDARGRSERLRLARAGAFDEPQNIESREVLVRSHDGVMVPASIISRRGLELNGRNPTLLYGYGAYGTFEAPGFNPRLLAWLERGGVYVIAHVRGGGVFGSDWHQAGRKTTKPNTWRDGIAVAQWLVDQKITSPAQLAVYGGSAGGIFVGRAATERPDLFAAAVSSVGVLDTVRSETRANGVANVPEYGTVAKEDEFRALLQMSSYAALKEGTRYPAFLLTHGVNDIRVDVWQSSKFAARAQALRSQDKPVLMLLDYDAGHGSGTSRAQSQQRQADVWAFLLWQFGDPAFQPAR